ncbi:MAG TPA: phenylacetate--CoA ligase family protein [Acidimicrobiales bacterium]|nr:phenylacetate--CoA ligase family protein [Acidimicrobiales bacterium]
MPGHTAETIPTSEELDRALRWTVGHAHEGSPFYRRHLDDFPYDVATFSGRADLASLPFTTKADLRSAYPLGWTAVPESEVRRIHASSGTTGKRTVASYTEGDIADWAEQFARCYRYAGVTETDRVQIMVGYGLWTAGVGFQAGCEQVGAMAIPAGPGNTDLQIELMIDLEATVLCGTSSFLLLLAEKVGETGVSDRLALRTGILGSERSGTAMRRRIEDLLGLETFDIYGMTELYGPGTGIECSRHDGMHYWSDYYLIEVVDPETLAPLPDGESGELVLTTLRKEAMPLIRYRTRDISRILPEPCPCGSPYPRIERLTGRTDDMVKVRGVAIFPAMVDTTLERIPAVGSEYQIHVDRDESGRDNILIRVEAEARAGLTTTVQSALRSALGVRVDVEVVAPGSLPRSERKTRRMFDHRD